MKDTIKIVALAAALTLLVIAAHMLLTGAIAEETTRTVFVMCNPESYVNIRERPSKHARITGYALCGDGFETDGIVRDGFVHVQCPTELGEGWISSGFVTYTEPEEVGETWIVDSNGRVAARSTIGGPRKKWLKKGKEVTVYYIADVAITNHGFVDAEFLSPVPAENR